MLVSLHKQRLLFNPNIHFGKRSAKVKEIH